MRTNIVIGSLLALVAAACSSGQSPTERVGADESPLAEGCGLPSGGLYATFDVVGETYSAQITNPQGILEAIALWQGKSTANIPVGDLVCEPVAYNCPWRFHQDPATIRFGDNAIEVCDGTPSYVSENCKSFFSAYCPWAAQLISLRDCRTDPTCPMVPKK